MKQKELEKLYNTQTIPIVKYENDLYRLNSKYRYGSVVVSKHTATLNLTNNSSQKIYIEFDKLNGAYNDDKVIVQIMFNPKTKIKAKVVHILSTNDNEILCYKKENIIVTIKENITIANLETLAKQIKDGDVIIIKNNKLVKTLGNINDPKVDELISLYLGNELYRLDQSVYDIPNSLDETNSRVDLTNLNFVTIDPKDAKDHDDAIYFDEIKKEIYVAIADVSAFVKENSTLDIDAKKRAFSIYLPHKVLPMLPFELSADLCSLVPNKKRFAFVFKLKLDKNNDVEKADLFEAIIESKHRYSYEYIDDILEQNDPSNIYVKLYNVAKQIRKQRLKNGYDFRNVEVRQLLDEDMQLIKTTSEVSTPSHSLIEECMLLANQESAKRLKTLGIFRVHDEPTQNKIKKLLDEANMLGLKVSLKKDIHSTILHIQQKARQANLDAEVDELIIQSQQQAKYGHTKKLHFGLGFENYSHFTSPIRRYSDLVLHRILKTNKTPQDIEQICEDISTTEREIISLVWDFEDRKYARYMQDNIDKVFSGIIADTISHIVKLDNQPKGARVVVENYSGEKLFTNVKIKIINSDIVTKIITAKII